MNVFSQWGLYCLCRFCNTRRASLSFLTPKKKMTVWIELALKLMSCWPAFFTFSSSKVFKTSGNSPKIWGRSKPSRTTWHYKVILGHKTAKHLLIDITKHFFLFVIPIWSKRGRTQFISSRERERVMWQSLVGICEFIQSYFYTNYYLSLEIHRKLVSGQVRKLLLSDINKE